MSELENQKRKTDKIINQKLTKSEKQLLDIYKGSLTNIRSKLLELNERSNWNLNDLQKYDRLNKLQNDILIEIKNLSQQVYDEIKNTNKDVVLTEYNRDSFAFVKESEILLQFQKLNPELAKAFVEMPYPNVPLQDFIKKIGSDTYNKIKMIIGTGLISSDTLPAITKQIKDLLGISYNQALRIMRTESLRARSKAALEVTQQSIDMGLDVRKRWMSTLDFRTRPDHQKLDGQLADKNGYFHVSGYKAQAPRMFGVPSEDINCRCTYVEEIVGLSEPLQKRKDNVTKELINNMTYEEWYAKYRVKS